MNPKQIEDFLFDLLSQDMSLMEWESDMAAANVQTFAKAGLITNDKGLVIDLMDEDGKIQKFILTIKEM